jgi:SulP family sulfate permease
VAVNKKTIDSWGPEIVFKNLFSGLTVAVVALPLALAFGIGSGLGAQAGLVTAAIAGVIASALGGSKYQVSGPTGAMTVILIPIVAAYGVSAVLQVGLMAGVFLILAAVLRIGRHIHRLPTALVEGFTAGIAIVISMQQVAFVLGVKLETGEHIWQNVLVEAQTWLQEPAFAPVIIGVLALVGNILGSHRWPKFPLALLSVVILTLAANFLELPLTRIGSLPSEFANLSFDFLAAGNWPMLIAPALAVAFLAGLESLLSAKISDRMAQSGSHNPSRELFGQGVANLVVPFFGGVPATAALARTAVNVRAGATSRLSAISHGVFLLLFVVLVSDWIAQIPLAALGGVLISTAYHMVKIRELRHTARGSRLDALVLIATLIATVFLDLISALVIGLIIHLALRKTRISKRRVPIDPDEILGD